MSEENDGNRSGVRIQFRRISYLIFGFILINFSFYMWVDAGYLDISVMAAIWILLGLSVIMIVYSVYNGEDIQKLRIIPVLGFIISMYVLLSVLLKYIPAFGTDEIAIDYYAAYLTVHGHDPYLNANMLNVFSFTAFPQSLITPLVTGGAVQYFAYPGLSAILFIPSVIFNFPPYLVLLAFNFGFMFILYLYFRKQNLPEFLPLIVVAMLIDAEFSLYSIGGVTDIVWVTFVALSYMYRNDWRVAGSFYGLALAFKQIPIIILPFYLYFLYRQEGYTLKKTASFIAIAAFAFIVPNIPYIIMNPYDWFSNILLVAYQPILGVGIGPSVLSFAGFLYIPSRVFEIALIFTAIFLFYLYVIKFRVLKYAFFAFPMVIFLLNYRALENYVIYWPIFILLIIPDALRRKKDSESTMANRKRTSLFRILNRFRGSSRMLNVVVIFLIISGAAASAGYEYAKTPSIHSPFEVMNVTSAGNPYMVPGDITSLNVMMNYTPINGGPSSFPVYFRIFIDGKINNVNSLLWSSSSLIQSGITNVTIYPNTASDLLPVNSSFVLEAYYSNYTSFVSIKKMDVPYSVIFPDPGLNYPTYSRQNPYPGWTLQSSSGASSNTSYVPAGTYLNMNVHSNNTWNYASMTGNYNFSYLVSHGYRLSYGILRSMTNVSTVFVNNNITEFAGVLLTFNQGIEKMWIGYNRSSTGSYHFINRDDQYIITNSTDINFSAVQKLGSQYNWSFSDPTFSFYIGVMGGHGSYHLYFTNTSLYNYTGGLLHLLNYYAYQDFNKFNFDSLSIFNNIEVIAVVEADGRALR